MRELLGEVIIQTGTGSCQISVVVRCGKIGTIIRMGKTTYVRTARPKSQFRWREEGLNRQGGHLRGGTLEPRG